MKQRILALVLFILSFSPLFAQQAPLPKYASKVQKAIVQLNTFDKDGNVLHTGTAFYVGENGEALADYALMKDAYRAVVTDQNGKTADVDCIKGADDTYSMVRFLVNTKGNAVLSVSTTAIPQGGVVYALPFTQQKSKVCASGRVLETSPVKDLYSYYTLCFLLI